MINYTLNESIKNRLAFDVAGSLNKERRTVGCLKMNGGEIQLGKTK